MISAKNDVKIFKIAFKFKILPAVMAYSQNIVHKFKVHTFS